MRSVDLAPGLLLLAACAVAPSGRAPVDPPTAEGVCATVVDGPRAASLERVVAGILLALDLPGATAAVSLPSGEVVSVSAGVSDLERGARLMPGARMPAGSAGKTFFAALALGLQRDGALDLDARLADVVDAPWLSRAPNGETVTLRQLLRHTSGVPEHVYDPRLAGAVAAQPDRVWGHMELARLLEGREALFEPGDGWSYADANYILAGLGLEATLQGDAYAACVARFIEPLGLSDTLPQASRDLPGVVQGHVVLGQRLGWPARTVGEDGRFVLNPQFEWAGGGWVSSSADLARWAHALWSGRLLGDAARADLEHWTETPDGPGDAYGLGTILTRTGDPLLGDAVGHDGFFPGYLTSVVYFPASDLAVAVQVNTDDVRALGGRLLDVLALPVARAALALP